MSKLDFITTIEARMTSTRLPGKVLRKFRSSNPIYDGLSCLEILIDRIKSSSFISDIVIATSNNSTDDVIENFCVQNNINYYRGSELDVLDRLAGAIKHQVNKHVIQLTGDNPFIDPEVIDYVVRFYEKEYPKYDFVTNNGLMNLSDHEIPIGMDVSVFSAKNLINNSRIAKNKAFREHPNLFFYKNSQQKFNCLNVPIPGIWKRKNKVRLTFDTEKDYLFLQNIYDHFSKDTNKFNLKEILEYIDMNVDILKLNSDINQKIPSIK